MRQGIRRILEKRICIFGAVLLVMFFMLVRRFFYLQILNGRQYQETFQSMVERQEIYPGSRGIIYDRNGKALAYNELSYSITIEDTGAYENRRSRNEALNRIISESIDLIERNGDSVISNLFIAVDDSREYVFTVEGTRLQRFLADVYGHSRIEELSYNARLGYDEGEATAKQVMEYLFSDSMYGISGEDTPEKALQIASVRYALGNNQYQRYIKTDLAEDVSQETMVAILENQAHLPGVDVSENMVRRYEDSEYFAHILGYTGPVSEEELEEYERRGIQYDRNDIVGKAGIEQAMEQELHGRNGGEHFFVDNVGRVTEVVETVEASTGNNIYLTIDADLQKAIYRLLEQKLAGILLANIVPAGEETSDLSIPIQDVYYALIDNYVIDIEQLGREEAGAEERSLYRIVEDNREAYVARLQAGIREPVRSLEEDEKAGMDFILEMLEREEYYRSDEVDRTTEIYRQWQEQEISLEEFLRYGISEGFIVTGTAGTDHAYSVIEENMEQLEQLIFTSIREEEEFDLLLYRMLIEQGTIRGADLPCSPGTGGGTGYRE